MPATSTESTSTDLPTTTTQSTSTDIHTTSKTTHMEATSSLFVLYTVETSTEYLNTNSASDIQSKTSTEMQPDVTKTLSTSSEIYVTDLTTLTTATTSSTLLVTMKETSTTTSTSLSTTGTVASIFVESTIETTLMLTRSTTTTNTKPTITSSTHNTTIFTTTEFSSTTNISLNTISAKTSESQKSSFNEKKLVTIATVSACVLLLVFIAAGGIAFYIKHKKTNRVNPDLKNVGAFEMTETFKLKNENPQSTQNKSGSNKTIKINSTNDTDGLTSISV